MSALRWDGIEDASAMLTRAAEASISSDPVAQMDAPLVLAMGDWLLRQPLELEPEEAKWVKTVEDALRHRNQRGRW